MIEQLVTFALVVLKIILSTFVACIVILCIWLLDLLSRRAYPSNDNKALDVLKVAKEWGTIMMFVTYLVIKIYTNFFQNS